MADTPVLQVAVPAPLRQLFDYLPAGGPLPEVGCRCEVDFAGRRLIGMVLGHGQGDGKHRLKPIRKVLDESPVLDADLLELCRRAASYYHHPIGEVIHTALPVLLRQGEPAELTGSMVWCLTARGRFAEPMALKRAPRQQQALELLAEHPKGLSGTMLASLGVSRQPLSALEKKGWLELVSETPAAPPEAGSNPLAEVPLQANAEQDAAIRAIGAARGFAPWLLDGVTGSGKTEVYLQAMTEHLRAGRQVLMLVPEIGLTPQTLRRFRNRFSVPLTLLHSGLTDRERLQAWLDAREGRARIIIGTRSAVFVPLSKPGLIIVDEAHDSSFKQQDGFRYSARDLAVWRAQLLDIPIVLGTATPALETLHQAESGRYRHLRLTQRAGDALAPRLMLEDCRQLPANTPLSPGSLDAIGHTLKAGRQALVFINRRGFAPMLMCQDCGWQSECQRCDAHMTWHRAEHSLRCHHCGARQRVPSRCPGCGSPHLAEVGSGTERLEAILQERFPDYPVIRIDRDSTRRKGSLDKQLDEIRRGRPAVLVGTQMLAKGHHFSQLDLAVILDADTGFVSADFRGPEHATQLLLQVAGRTGRGQHPGQVIIQTRFPDNPLLRLLTRGDYPPLAEQLLTERRVAGLPPFGFLALVRCESLRPDQGMQLLAEASQSLGDTPGVDRLGPVPAPMEKRAGRYRQQLLLHSTSRKALHDAIHRLLPAIEQHPLARRCRWHLDVDPVEML